MLCPPPSIVAALAPFAPLFSRRVCAHVQVLLAGALLAPAQAIRQAAWYRKDRPTFADALALIRRELWRHQAFHPSSCNGEVVNSQLEHKH